MIFERSLQRELAYTAGAVFMVLLTIMLTTMMIRIVGFAASGEVDPRDVVVLIGLTVIGYLAVMLIVTLFVSILFVLTRWYRDSEMVVWLASGVSQTQLIKPIARLLHADHHADRVLRVRRLAVVEPAEQADQARASSSAMKCRCSRRASSASRRRAIACSSSRRCRRIRRT